MRESQNQLLEQERQGNEQKESAEQLSSDQLYDVFKAFDHIQDYTDPQLDVMYEKIHADLVTNRFSQMKPDHLKRDEKELKDARREYKIQKEKGKDPLPVYEEVTADDLVQFVFQSGLSNAGADLMEISKDRFGRLELNVEQGEEEEFEKVKKAITPELILLAKIKLEKDARKKNKTEVILPPDAKLNRDAVDNLDAVGLAIQLKSMPNIKEPKDMIKWGYTPREAIYLHEWSKYAQTLLDPEETGSISFGTEEEMEEVASKLAAETEKVYPKEANTKLQKQAMLRRTIKYLQNEEVLLARKGPEAIGLAIEESQADKIERMVHLVARNLHEDTELEPEQTRLATRNFREQDLVGITQSLLELKKGSDQEEKLESFAKVVKLLGQHYDLFNSIQKDEFGLPELHDQSLRESQSEKSANRIIELIRLSSGVDAGESGIADDVKKYIRLLVELDHNASMRRVIFQKGAGISNRVFSELEIQEKDLANQYAKEVGELDKAIGATRLRPSDQLRKIDLVSSTAQKDLQKTQRILSGDEPIISKDLELAQKRMNEVLKQREDLLFLKRIFEEKLGIKE